MSFYINPCDISYSELLCDFPKLLPPAMRGGQIDNSIYSIEKPTVEKVTIYNDPSLPSKGCVKFIGSLMKITPDPEFKECTGLGAIAQWLASSEYDILRLQIYPLIRELHPSTAFTSQDQWLRRLGWGDCFDVSCGNFIDGLPDNVDIWCGDSNYIIALKHAILQALSRIRNGIIANLENINTILSPLGVKAQAANIMEVYVVAPTIESYELSSNGEICLKTAQTSEFRTDMRDSEAGNEGNCSKEFLELELHPIPGFDLNIPPENCDMGERFISPILTCPNSEMKDPFYANVLAAACIIRALIYDRHIKITPFWQVNP